MDSTLNLFDLLKSGFKLVNHQLILFRLNTAEKHIINTNYGQIQGVKRKTFYDEQFYYAFEDIPYGKPPLNDLRFRAPQPPDAWQGVRDCTKWRHKPLQKHSIMGIAVGSEDCLYLNIYVKNLKRKKSLPVMVWLYGGGFQTGEATTDFYAPDYFMLEEVVLVEINYRISALGFLSFCDPDVRVPGNAGLKDQLLALRWIQDNIEFFNGDKNNVTLFGESAGSASVHLLMLSDKAKGLFHKAILQSGVATMPCVNLKPGAYNYELARKLGYKGVKNDKDIFDFLLKANGSDIVYAAAELLTKEDAKAQVWFPFVPLVEPYISDDSLITKNFKELQRTTWSNEIPIIIGGNSDEGLLSMKYTIKRPYLVDELGDCQAMLPKDLNDKYNVVEQKEMGLKLKNAYFGDKVPNFKENLMPFLELSGDLQFWQPIYSTTLARCCYATNVATYLYRFDFDSKDFNIAKKLFASNEIRGTAHGDDISYLFFNALAWKLSQKSTEFKTIKLMIAMWTTFAKSGNPNVEILKPIGLWQPVNDKSLKCLNISKDIEFVDLPNNEKMKLWNSLYTKEPAF